jgi:Family of unknown function (DUF6212)
MLRLAVITTARADQIVTDPAGSLFDPIFVTADHDLVDARQRPFAFASLLNTPCVALVGWSEADTAILERMQARLVESKAAILPDIVILEDRPSWESMMLGVAHCLEQFVLLQAKLIGQQTRDLLELRRYHDSLQESFSGLERYLAERTVPMLEETFSCEARQPMALTEFKAKPARPKLRQYLPVSTKTLGAVAVHVDEADPAASGHFVAEIFVPELNMSIATWRLPVAFLQRGWLTLGLQRTFGGLPKTAHLMIWCDGDAGRAKLSLGPVHPLPLYQLSTSTGESVAARSLALRVFIALPGIELKHDELTFLPDEVVGETRAAPIRLNRLHVPLSQLEKPRFVLPRNAEARRFELVKLIDEQGAVLVHPQKDEPTIVLFERCIPSGAKQITADILVDNPAAQTVGFRMGVVDTADLDRVGVDMMGVGPFETLRVSDWAFTGPGRAQTLTLPLDAPVGPEGASLLLATRMPDQMSPDFAWAKFMKLRVELV